jgi:hypothetical protein
VVKGDNINQDLLSGLNSPDENTVAETIRELRLHGNVDVLPALFSLLFSGRMENLVDEIVNLLNDVKDPHAVPVFMDGIKKYRGKDGFEKLVSACWQCGLDFSPYIDQFIDLVIEEDYYPSLEAFSVIEENISAMSSQQRTARLEFVRSKLELLSPEKRLLVNELMSLLSNFSGPFRLDPDHLN